MRRRGTISLFHRVLDLLPGPNRATDRSFVIAFDKSDLALRIYFEQSQIVGVALVPRPPSSLGVPETLQKAALRQEAVDDLTSRVQGFIDMARSSGQTFREVGLATCAQCGYLLGFPPCTH